jgi:hypothetical protein
MSLLEARHHAAPKKRFRRARFTRTGIEMPRNVDGRTLRARRYRDIVNSLVDELGGAAAISEADRILVRQAASLSLQAEELERAVIVGDAVSNDELVRLSGTARRLLETLRAKADTRKPDKAKPAWLGLDQTDDEDSDE